VRYGNVDHTNAKESCATICAASTGTGSGSEEEQQCVAFAITDTGDNNEKCIILHSSGPEKQKFSHYLEKHSATVGVDVWLYSVEDCVDERDLVLSEMI
jgi:hypothetical protein